MRVAKAASEKSLSCTRGPLDARSYGSPGSRTKTKTAHHKLLKGVVVLYSILIISLQPNMTCLGLELTKYPKIWPAGRGISWNKGSMVAPNLTTLLLSICVKLFPLCGTSLPTIHQESKYCNLNQPQWKWTESLDIFSLATLTLVYQGSSEIQNLSPSLLCFWSSCF